MHPPPPRVAIATCAAHPELDDEGRLLLAALHERGADVRPAVWDAAPPGGWAQFDAVVLRSTWDYTRAPADFLRWTRELGPRLHNAPDVVAWNVDKRYLLELAAAGVAVVASEHLAPGEPLQPPLGRFVVKPAISAGSIDTALYDETRHEAARAHVAALHAAGRDVLVQPFYARVETDAETAVIFLDGVLSHSMRKAALLELDRPPADGLYYPEEMARRVVEPDVAALARQACAVVTRRFGPLLYARVDVLRDDAGAPALLELELIEPSLFLDYAPGSAQLLADALLARLPG